MFQDVDATLKKLLELELQPAAGGFSISFATPDAQFPPTSVTLPAINLFLYEIQENRELHRSDWTAERLPNGSVIKRPPPTRIDCSYLITVWPSSSAPDPASDEHSLLGQVTRALLRYRILPDEVLQGSLQGQEPPVRAIALQPTQLNGIGQFWQAMGGRPKVGINYTLTITMEPAITPLTAPLTQSQQIQFTTQGGA